MGTEKRERQKQGRQVRLEAARAAQQRSQRLRTIRSFAIVLVLIVVGIFVLSRVIGGNDTTTASTATSTASAGSSESAATTTTAVPVGADPTCPPAEGAATRTTTFKAAPGMCIDPAKTYTAKVDTTKGSFTIALDAAAAPKTVNNFVFLARYRYYDGVAFHRIIPGFVVQGGDANGNPPGSGGPGYEFADELPTGNGPYYEIGSVAMANSGANTNGSQFFVVTGDQGAQLPAKYSKFGKVTAGLDVVKALEAVGSSSGTPSEPVAITTVTISES